MSEVVLQKLREWRHSPLAFVKECIEVTPSSQQIEGLLEFARTKKMTIRSGHGTGKDAFASWCILWFMTTRPFAKVVCTAPTARQLNDILWSEMSKWIRKSILGDDFVVQKDKIFQKDNPKEWWIRGVSPSVKASKEEQAETLAGFHGDHLLIVVDEASGVPDPVYIPLEGALTQEDNRVLLIGNMTKNKGYFYDTHFHASLAKAWTRLHWDSRKSSNVHESMVQYFRDKYGENSNVFRIRVAGDPPLEDLNTLIPLAWAIQCVGNEIEVATDEPLYLGVDVARYGEDASIILPRKGLKIFPWETYRGMNTIDLGGFVKQTYTELIADGLAIDEIGVGAGVTDWLMKHDRQMRVFGVNVATASADRKKADRLRDQLWLAVREKCMKGIYSFPDTVISRGGMDVNLGHELADELASPTYKFNKEGGIIVESKRDMKLRGVESPNIADALCLTEYFHDVAYRIWGNKAKGGKKQRDSRAFPSGRAGNRGRKGWMAA